MGRGVQVRLAGPSGVAASRRVTTGEGAACAERATIDVHVGGFRVRLRRSVALASILVKLGKAM